MIDHAEPDARLVFSCGWHITRDGLDQYSVRLRAFVRVIGTLARMACLADLDDQVRACRRNLRERHPVDRRPGQRPRGGTERGPPHLAKARRRPRLAKNRTRRTDFALLMFAALDDETLVQEAPAIVGAEGTS